GNNNAYCQDNETSWIDWNHMDESLMEFTSRLIHFRLSHPAFCRNKWFQYKSIKGIKDIEWFMPEGSKMHDKNWDEALAKSLGIFMSGDSLNLTDDQGQKIFDASFYIIFNSDQESVIFTIPDIIEGSWYRILDTWDSYIEPESEDFPLKIGETIEVRGRSVILLINKKQQK
ncbi:MAG TPA: hypothetical protein VHO68_03835, partial [Bacteroidales bacterium]|nr:hypothetical protein [Bacteroidales bacterium]